MALRINKSNRLNRRCTIVDPTDHGVLKSLAKKSTRDGEEGRACQAIGLAEWQAKEIELFRTEPVLCVHGCDHSHFLAQLAAKDAEIERLKKFDVKFCAEYDADLKPVGRTCDLLEWQAKLQSELKIEQLHHKNAKAELAALRAQSAESEGARMEREFLRSHGECPRSWCNDERHTWTPVRWTREAAKEKD